MTNSIGEIVGNDVLFIIGSNATEAHPIIGNKMKQAAARGAKLIVIDPRRTELADHSYMWLQIRPGTDNAFINGVLHTIITNDWHDKAYIEERTEGWDDLWETVKDYPAERASEITGIPAEQIVAAAELYAKTEKAGIFYTLGITEHTVGTANVMNLANLGMITGHIGKPNAGVNPMRGQNNVQGSCDMGALPNSFPGYPSVLDEAAKAKFSEAYGVPMPDEDRPAHPRDARRRRGGQAQGHVRHGRGPGPHRRRRQPRAPALQSLDLLVVQNIFMTETATHADVFLPAALYAEKDGTFTNTERRVQRVRKAVEPPDECRPDWEIILDLAERLGYPMPFSSPEEVFQEVSRLVPTFGGITWERIENEGGVQWPCPTPDHPGTPYLHQGKFTRGKGLLQGIPFQPPAEIVDDEYPTLLTTGRMLFHYNISTRISASLEMLRPWELAMVNPEDAAQLRLRRRRADPRELAPRLDHHTHPGHRPRGAGRHVHDVPLQGVAGQRAHQLGRRPGDQDGGVQGLRRQDGEAHAGRGRRRSRPARPGISGAAAK